MAVGIEAPMWCTTNLTIRFLEEGKGAHWWNPAASSATINAINIGVQIFSGLGALIKKGSLRSTTDINQWLSSNQCNILLFEGFVYGQYKIESIQWTQKRRKSHKDKKSISIHDFKPPEEHLWDAFLVASAFWEYHSSSIKLQNNLGNYKSIVQPITYQGDVLSHWHTILRKARIPRNPVSDQDCLILSIQ
ncbi:hypothetical protein MT997_28360 [Paenibacillus sp. OVF10]|nr:hypothetical protein MT997_28360 [Paenibacillus sp. OVF10]